MNRLVSLAACALMAAAASAQQTYQVPVSEAQGFNDGNYTKAVTPR